MGTNVSTNYINAPLDPKKTLSIKLPFLFMIIKNLKKYFTFEVKVLDDKSVRRRFRASNFQSTTRVKPFICTMPMRLDEGWNQIQFNLSDFTRRAYGTNYIETLRVQIHANCRPLDQPGADAPNFPSRFSRRWTRPCKFFCRQAAPAGCLVEAISLLHRKQLPCRPNSTKLRRVLFAEFFSPPSRPSPCRVPVAREPKLHARNLAYACG